MHAPTVSWHFIHICYDIPIREYDGHHHLLLGPEVPTMLRNLLRNLEEQRVRVVQAIFAC